MTKPKRVSPELVQTPDFRERFFARTAPEGDCVVWTACCGGTGYGQVWVAATGRIMLAHNAAWMIACGAIPEGLFVLHKCRRRHCVSTAHLYLGTLADNARDSIRDGTHPSLYARGERHGAATLTEGVVREMRARRSRGESLKALASDYQTCVSNVSAVCLRKTWTLVH